LALTPGEGHGSNDTTRGGTRPVELRTVEPAPRDGHSASQPSAAAGATPSYGPIPTAEGAVPTGMGATMTASVVVSITVTLLLVALAT
jgi:hypothetical protein